MEPLKHGLAADSSPDSLSAVDAELVMLRERVAELDRLASIGQLTAGILHEVKNPLSFINNYARLSIELTGEIAELIGGLKFSESEVSDELEGLMKLLDNNLIRIRENGARAERIILGTLAQTHTDSHQFELTDLNTLLEEYTKLAYQGVRAGDKTFVVSLSFQFDSGIDKVLLAPYEFNRVILNLVLNACYAVNEKRKKLADYKPTITVISQKFSDRIEVKIRDNGEGIPDEVKNKLFTPFFTTKPAGKGTGLGLSLSRDVINRLHKGSLSVNSEPGSFTEFTISLPFN